VREAPDVEAHHLEQVRLRCADYLALYFLPEPLLFRCTSKGRVFLSLVPGSRACGARYDRGADRDAVDSQLPSVGVGAGGMSGQWPRELVAGDPWGKPS
jgi:hypothetical protein